MTDEPIPQQPHELPPTPGGKLGETVVYHPEDGSPPRVGIVVGGVTDSPMRTLYLLPIEPEDQIEDVPLAETGAEKAPGHYQRLPSQMFGDVDDLKGFKDEIRGSLLEIDEGMALLSKHVQGQLQARTPAVVDTPKRPPAGAPQPARLPEEQGLPPLPQPSQMPPPAPPGFQYVPGYPYPVPVGQPAPMPPQAPPQAPRGVPAYGGQGQNFQTHPPAGGAPLQQGAARPPLPPQQHPPQQHPPQQLPWPPAPNFVPPGSVPPGASGAKPGPGVGY